MTQGGACSDVFTQVADRGAGGVGLGRGLFQFQHELDEPDVLVGTDVSESCLG